MELNFVRFVKLPKLYENKFNTIFFSKRFLAQSVHMYHSMVQRYERVWKGLRKGLQLNAKIRNFSPTKFSSSFSMHYVCLGVVDGLKPPVRLIVCLLYSKSRHRWEERGRENGVIDLHDYFLW